MSVTKVIRYTAKPQSAEENERLVRGVFAELAREGERGCATPSSASTTGSASCTWPCSTAT